MKCSACLRSKGFFDALNKMTDPVVSDSDERDLLWKHSHENVFKLKTANGLLLDAFDGNDPPRFDESGSGQVVKHCLESAAGFLRAENDDRRWKSVE